MIDHAAPSASAVLRPGLLSRHRVVVWGTLLVIYMAAFTSEGTRAVTMDPMDPRPRAVEAAVAERRFAEAVPAVVELQQLHPDEPLVAYWAAAIHRGLEQPRAEIAAWERLLALSPESDAACPSLGRAYQRAGDDRAAVAAFERCVALDRGSVERLLDVAEASTRAGDHAGAAEALTRAAALEPALARHVSAGPLADGTAAR
jgi:tetratricopeptide (TPR) repeat protein